LSTLWTMQVRPMCSCQPPVISTRLPAEMPTCVVLPKPLKRNKKRRNTDALGASGFRLFAGLRLAATQVVVNQYPTPLRFCQFCAGDPAASA
jgi:hypothetical protein